MKGCGPSIITCAEAKKLGLTRYFTGKPCLRGHIVERRVDNCCCVDCIRLKDQSEHKRELNHKYYEANHEKIKRRSREWELNNPERKRAWRMLERNRKRNIERCQKWKETNRARAAEGTRNWQLANPEKVRKNSRKSYEANHEARKQMARDWSKANPDAKVVHAHSRRARELGAGGSHTRADLAEILQAQKHRCVYCPADLRKVKRHLDHIMPLKRGGSNDKSNLQYLCATCNLRKQGKDPLQYARELGLLL